MRANSGESWTVRCGRNCGIPMTGGGGRVMSDSCGSRAGMNCDISVTGGGRPVAGGSGPVAGGGGGPVAGGGGLVAGRGGPVGGRRTCCASGGCRCHREGWQKSSGLFVRTVFPCSLGYKQSQQDQTHREPHGRAAQSPARL